MASCHCPGPRTIIRAIIELPMYYHILIRQYHVPYYTLTGNIICLITYKYKYVCVLSTPTSPRIHRHAHRSDLWNTWAVHGNKVRHISWEKENISDCKWWWHGTCAVIVGVEIHDGSSSVLYHERNPPHAALSPYFASSCMMGWHLWQREIQQSLYNHW